MEVVFRLPEDAIVVVLIIERDRRVVDDGSSAVDDVHRVAAGGALDRIRLSDVGVDAEALRIVRKDGVRTLAR